MCIGQTMGAARIDLQRRIFDELRREHGRGRDRYDLIVIAVDDQRRHIEFLQVLGKIRQQRSIICNPRSCLSECAAAPQQIHHHYDCRDHQQKVDQSTADVSHEAQQP
jgi:hypothetical protein